MLALIWMLAPQTKVSGKYQKTISQCCALNHSILLQTKVASRSVPSGIGFAIGIYVQVIPKPKAYPLSCPAVGFAILLCDLANPLPRDPLLS